MTATDTSKALSSKETSATDRVGAGAIVLMLIAVFAVLDTVFGVGLMKQGYTNPVAHSQGLPVLDFLTGGFMFGLGVIQYSIYTNGLHLADMNQAMWLTAAIGLTLALFFGYFSVRAREGLKWAFLMGIVVYALDAVLLVTGWDLDYGNFNPLAVHLILLVLLYRGYVACSEIPSTVDEATGAPVAAQEEPAASTADSSATEAGTPTAV